jgi:hypothetical protein
MVENGARVKREIPWVSISGTPVLGFFCQHYSRYVSALNVESEKGGVPEAQPCYVTGTSVPTREGRRNFLERRYSDVVRKKATSSRPKRTSTASVRRPSVEIYAPRRPPNTPDTEAGEPRLRPEDSSGAARGMGPDASPREEYAPDL